MTLILLLIVTPFLFQGKIIEIVKTEANGMLNAKIDFGKLNLSFIRNFPNASVAIDDFYIVGVGDFENDTLAAFDRLSVSVNIQSLFGEQMTINRVVLKKPRIYAKVLPDGKVNWDVMKAPDTTAVAAGDTAAATAFNLQLKKITVDDGYIVYDDRESRMKAVVGNANISLSGDMTQDVTMLRTKIEIGKLSFLMDDVAYLNNATFDANINAEADLTNYKFTLSENELQLNNIKLNLDGWLALLDEGFDMDVKLNTPSTSFKNLLSMIPAIYAKDFETIHTQGNLTFDAQAKGVYRDSILPAFDVRLNVADASFKYPDLPKSVDNIRIAVAVANPGGVLDLTTVDVSQFYFEIAKNPFDVRFKASTPISDLRFDAGAKGTLDLDVIKEVYPLDGMTLSGLLKADFEMAGRLSQIEKEQYESVNAKGDLSLSGFTYTGSDMPPVLVQTAQLTFTPKYAALTNFDMKIGNSDIQANGKLSNYIAYILKDETIRGELNIASSLLHINDFMGDDDASAAADTPADSAAIEIPKNIDFKLNASLKKVVYDSIILENIKGNITVGDRKLNLRNVGMNAFGGTMNATGFYSTEDAANPRVDMTLNIKDVLYTDVYRQMDMVKQFAPIFENMTGRFSLDCRIDSKLDNTMSPVYASLMGNGVLTSKDMSVSNIKALDVLAATLKNDNLKTLKAKDVKVKFEIKNGRIYTEPFTLNTGVANLVLSGSTGLDKTIDYKADIELPQSLVSGVLPQSLKDVKMKVTATFGGVFSKPTVTLGAAETLSNVKDVVVNELKSKANAELQKVVDEAKKQSDALVATAQKQANNVRAEAQKAGDKLVDEAKKQSDALVAKAKNPIAKIAAQKAGDELVKVAQNKAADLNKTADEQANKLVDTAQKQGDKLVKEAEEKAKL